MCHIGACALRVLFTEHKKRLALRLALCVCPSRSLCALSGALCGALTTSGHYQRPLPAVLGGNGEFLAAVATAGVEYAASIGGSHALAESVLVDSLAG